ncbi:MAG: hypothetical protein CNLJKLNK_00252 [Holosporales bacterium]
MLKKVFLIMKTNTPLKTKSAMAVFTLLLTQLNATEQGIPQTENPSMPNQERIITVVPAVKKLTKEEVVDQILHGVTGNIFYCCFYALSQKMWGDIYKANIMKMIGYINPESYTNTFVNTVNQLSKGMNSYDKGYITMGVGKVHPDRYTDPFINTVNQLSKGMNSNNKAHVITIVGKIHPDRYTDFINIVQHLSKKMNDNDKASVVEAVSKVDPNRYTDFISTVNQLSEEMNTSDKAKVIWGTGNVHSDRYTDAFINIVHQFSDGMDGNQKALAIAAIGKIHPDHYADFISTVTQLSQEVNVDNKTNIVEAVSNVDPNRYTDFINTVHHLSQEMDNFSKERIIEAVAKIDPDHYSFLQNFITQNPRYFEYVPAQEFNHNITPNMTQQQLQDCFQIIHRNHYHQAPAGTPKALAFEIHNFANQNVVGETGQKQVFQVAVLNHIQKSIQGPDLDYDIVLDLLSVELETLKNDSLKSDAINEDVYNWVIQANEDQQDKNAIATVVTYLEQKDNTHEKLATWLYAFMDESKKAYDGKNTQSCIKGVKERVITSLRSAIPEGDAALENLFHQAETPFMIAAQSKKLTDYAFWAEKLQQKGVTSATHKDIAKDKFKEALVDFFGANEGAQEIIDETLETFDDSSDLSSDGLWSKIKLELLKIEPSAA